MEKERQVKELYHIIIGIVALIAVAALFTLFDYHYRYQKVQDLAKQAQTYLNQEAEMANRTQAIYLEDRPAFLSSLASQTNMEDLLADYHELVSQQAVGLELVDQVQDLVNRYQAQLAANDLYRQGKPAIYNGSVNVHHPLHDSISQGQLDYLHDNFLQGDLLVEDDFKQSLSAIYDYASKEYSAYQLALKELAVLGDLPLEFDYLDLLVRAMLEYEDLEREVTNPSLVKLLQSQVRDLLESIDSFQASLIESGVLEAESYLDLVDDSKYLTSNYYRRYEPGLYRNQNSVVDLDHGQDRQRIDLSGGE